MEEEQQRTVMPCFLFFEVLLYLVGYFFGPGDLYEELQIATVLCVIMYIG